MGQLLSLGMNEVCELIFHFLSVFELDWTGRASGGDREEEQRDVGKWFSRWDPICETMHPKETFSHGPTTWIQIHPTTEQEGQMHLASTRSGGVQPFSFFFYPSIQSKTSTEVTSWQLLWVTHSYLCQLAQSFCSYSVSWTFVFIMRERVSMSMLAKI